jgi:HK97 family phage major capsid protein
MKTIEEVLQALQEATHEMRSYVDKKLDEIREEGQPRPETESAIEQANNAITELRSQYEELQTKFERPASGDAAPGNKADEQAALEQRAYDKYLRYGFGENGRAHFDEDEIRALSSASDADGGFQVPVSWESDLITQAFDEGELRAIIGAAPTSRDTVFMPALAKPVVAWGIANLAVSAQDIASGGERISIHDLKALVLIHNNTLEDADADIWSELSSMFGMAVGEAEDDAWATGSGSGEPKGIVTDSRVQANYTKTGVAADLSDASNNGVDALLDGLYSLKKTYRRNATFAMNSTTEAKVRQFKDSNGQYLWQPPVQAGAPATLLGRPSVNPEGMPAVAADAFPIAIGDFRRGYRIRDRKGLTITRLIERYAEFDQTGFMVKRRTGGQVVLAEAFHLIKCEA